MRLFREHICEWAMAAAVSVTAAAAPLPVERTWAAEVAPLLDKHCFKCHGGVHQRGSLDARSLENLLRGGETGSAVVPGKPEESNLFKFVQAEGDPHMPPKKQLSAEEMGILKRWIEQLPTAESLNVSTDDKNWRVEYVRALEGMRKPVWTPESGMAVHAVIDRFVEIGWEERGVKGAGEATDAEFARRVYLDFAGRIPTLDELNSFTSDQSENRKERLVDQLLASGEYARHMREVFDVVLMGRGGTRAERVEGQRAEHGWHRHLEESFGKNRPWNEMVRDWILARRTEGDEKGAEWFLYERRNNHQAMAEAVAPVAFGVQIGCAQCHNHPLAWEVEQRHYWGLVATFNRSKNVEAENGVGVAESAIGGFVSFANLKKESQPAVLAFLTGKVVEEQRPGEGEKEVDEADKYVIPPPPDKEKAKQPAVPKISRREALAKAATEDNPRLARAFVNRAWAMLMGRGLVHPVDQLDSRHPASHPDLLDWLAKEFERSGYDVKRLMRELALTRTYQLSSRPADGMKPPVDAFARATEKPLSAEQLSRSFLVATGQKAAAKETEYRRAFAEKFPELFAEEYNATLQQAMFVSNSNLLDGMLGRSTGNTTDRILSFECAEAQVEESFRAVLGRKPDAEEAEAGTRLLARRPGEGGVKDLLWGLLASAEFQLNH